MCIVCDEYRSLLVRLKAAKADRALLTDELLDETIASIQRDADEHVDDAAEASLSD